MTARLAVACALVLLAGCSGGRKPYAEDPSAKNVSIRTQASGVRAALHVHGVDAQCRTQYLGTVDLDKPALEIGLPAGRTALLVFDFSSSSFLRGSSRISRETLLRPRQGYRYEVEAKYRDDLYDVVVRERPPSGASRALPLLDLSSCR